MSPDRIRSTYRAAITIIVLAAIYELIARSGYFPPVLMPTLGKIGNSLLTGLRARDLEGRVTYFNPAFCRIVGIPAEDLIGKKPPMPYWAPEAMDEYQERFSKVLAGSITPRFETIFQRADGERFPVLVFEAPLMDDTGRQTGWMGSILDVSDLRRVENINRQQQEKLQASARLASMGDSGPAPSCTRSRTRWICFSRGRSSRACRRDRCRDCF